MKKTTIKNILIAIAILIAAGLLYGYYLYNKPVADTADLNTAFVVTAPQLFSEFENDESLANQRYLGKVIEVNGKVRDMSISDNGEINLILDANSEMFGINCGLMENQEENYRKFKVGD